MLNGLELATFSVAVAAPIDGPPTVAVLCRASNVVMVGVYRSENPPDSASTMELEEHPATASFEVETVIQGERPADLSFLDEGLHLNESVFATGVSSWTLGSRRLVALNWFPGNSVGMEPQWIRVLDWQIPASVAVPSPEAAKLMYREHCAEYVDGVPETSERPTETYFQTLDLPIRQVCERYNQIPGVKALQTCEDLP